MKRPDDVVATEPAPKTMNIKQDDFLDIDLQTRRDGNSAGLVAKDDTTEVYFGGLHAAVTLVDLRIRVTMNPDKGRWSDLEWARRRALEAILAPDTVVEVIVALCATHRKFGEREGRRELQRQFMNLLGCRP